jgi:hypothetical protein
VLQRDEVAEVIGTPGLDASDDGVVSRANGEHILCSPAADDVIARAVGERNGRILAGRRQCVVPITAVQLSSAAKFVATAFTKEEVRDSFSMKWCEGPQQPVSAKTSIDRWERV